MMPLCFAGILCIIFGVIINLLDTFLPNAATTFFGVDVLQDDDDTVEGTAQFLAKLFYPKNQLSSPSDTQG